MSDTSIEWTDKTWNPTTGCDRISPGCAKCYAKAEHDRRHKAFVNGWTAAPAQYHQPFEVVQVHESRLDVPLRWREPRMVFVNSVSDLFYGDDADRVRCERQGIPFHPVPDAFIDRVFAVMALAPQHTFQILTKRAERMRDYMMTPDRADAILDEATDIAHDHFANTAYLQNAAETSIARWPLPNVWLGVSVENQHFADERIPLLLQTPAAVRFISAEPLLGPVDLRAAMQATETLRTITQPRPTFLDWVIVGGESGHGARPFDVAWARSIVAQCKAAGVPVFVKQLGRDVRDRNDAGFEGDTPRSWPMDTDVEDSPNGCREEYQGAPVRVRLASSKGGDMAEWPADLRVREMPTVTR